MILSVLNHIEKWANYIWTKFLLKSYLFLKDFSHSIWRKIVNFINSYEWNIPLLIIIGSFILISLLFIVILIIIKKNKKIKEVEIKKEVETLNTEIKEHINNKAKDDTTYKSYVYTSSKNEELVSKEENTKKTTDIEEKEISGDIEELEEVSEKIEEVPSNKLKEELIESEVDFLEGREKIGEEGTTEDILLEIKNDLEAEFISLIKNYYPPDLNIHTKINLSETINEKINNLNNKLRKIEKRGNYKFSEEYYYYTFILYFYSDKKEESEHILKKGLKLNPESYVLNLALAYFYFFSNQIDKSKEILLNLKNNYPSKFDIYLLLGEIYFNENKFSDSLSMYKKVILLDPKNSRAYAYKGYILAKRGFISDGEKDLKKAISLNYKDFLPYYMLGEIYFESGLFHKSINMYKKAKKFKCTYKDIDTKLALAYFKIKKYPAVVSILKPLYKNKLLDISFIEILGKSLFELNLYEESAEVFEHLIKNSSEENKISYYYDILLKIYKKSNNLDKVIEILQKKLEKENDNIKIIKELGDIYYFQKKDIQKAKEFYEKEVNIEKDEEILSHLINIYFKERNYKKCIELFKELEKIIKTKVIPEIYYKVGLSYFKEKNYQNTIRLLSVAELTGWIDEELYNALGFSYLQTEAYNQAIEVYKKSIAINPYNFQTHNNLGIVYAKQNDLKNALKEFKEALKLEPGNKDILYNIYRIYKILSEEKAEKYLNQIEELIA